jgi:excisionase family DNA binding protein
MNRKSLTYSPKEVAQILGVCPTSIYRLIARKKIRVVPDLRHKRIPHSEVDRLLGGSHEGHQ